MLYFLFAAVLAAPPDVEARTLAGKSVAGAIAEMQTDRLVIHTGAGPVSLAYKELLKVTPASPPAASPVAPKAWLGLNDGSTLVGLAYKNTKTAAEFTLLDGQVVKLSTKSISFVRLKEQSETIAGQWQQIVDSKRASDVIVIRQGEAVDYLEGVLGDAGEQSVQFTLDGATSNVNRIKVDGLLYFHAAGKEPPTPLCQLTDAQGSRLQAAKFALIDGKLLVTTNSGVEVPLPLSSVAEFDFSLGKIQYLGDLKPDTMERVPYFGTLRGLDSDRYYDPKTDRSFDGGPLKLGNQTFSKGLAIKSRTKLVYRLPGKYSRFEAIAGIDASVAPLGSVRLIIRGEEAKPLFEGIVRGKDAAQSISLDITGVKRLTIEVDFGEGGDIGDHLDLCEARIIQ